MEVKRILVVEDDKLLSAVLSLFLSQLGHEMIAACESGEEALLVCENENPDLVLMDIHLADKLDGIQTAETIHEKFDIPVIFISGDTGASVMARTIKTNSHAFLLKPVYKTELGVNIELACAKHGLQKEIRVREHRYRLLLDLSPDTIVLVLEGKIEYINNSGLRLFETITIEDLLGEQFLSYFSGNDKIILERNIEQLLVNKANKIDLKGLMIETKNHKSHNVSIRGAIIEFNKSNAIQLIISDITEKRKAEQALFESQINLKSIFEGSTEGIFVIGNKLEIIDFNKLAKKYAKTFFQVEIRNGASFFDTLTFLDRSEFENLFENCLIGFSHFLERAFFFDEKRVHFKITIYPIFKAADEKIERFCISFLDISEKKKTEKELAETHAELKPMFDSSIQRFFLVDLDYKLVAFNKSAHEIIQSEFRRNLTRGDNILDFVPKAVGIEIFKKRFEEAKTGKHIAYKVRLTEYGTDYWIEAHLDPIKDETGETKRILFWTVDVTERENSIAAMRRSEERNSLVAKGGNDGLWDWDMITNELYLSPRWKTLLGYEEYEILNREILRNELIHPDDLASTRQVLKDYLSGDSMTYKNEYRIKHKKGHWLNILERGTVVRDEKNLPYRMAGTITDMTQQRKVEAEREEAHLSLLEERKMFMKGNVVVFRAHADIGKSAIYASENVESILGHRVEDFLSGTVNYSDLVHPDDLARYFRERNFLITNKIFHFEYSNYRLVKKDQSIIWVKDAASAIFNERGDVCQLLGYIIDISKEKEAEEALLENQKKYYTLFSKANDAILILDHDTVFDCNEMAEELYGYRRSELLGLKISMLSPVNQPNGESSALLREKRNEKIAGGENIPFEWQYKKKNGEFFTAEVSVNSVTLNKKEMLLAIVRDRTRRINIERKLKENEQKNKSLLLAIPDIIFIIDKNGNYLDYRAAPSSNLSVPSEQIIGKNQKDYFSGEKLMEMEAKLQLTLDTLEIQNIQYQLDSPIGLRWFESRMSPYQSDAVLLIARDVTERIEIESKMKGINQGSVQEH